MHKYVFISFAAWALTACTSDADQPATNPATTDSPSAADDQPTSSIKSNPDAGRDAAADLDAFASALDAAGLSSECRDCARTQCSSAVADCANDPTCSQGLVCTLSRCSSASSDVDATAVSSALSCTLGCFQSDLTAAMRAGSSASCLARLCPNACAALLPRDAGRDVAAMLLADRFLPTRDADTAARDASAQRVDEASTSLLDGATRGLDAQR